VRLRRAGLNLQSTTAKMRAIPRAIPAAAGPIGILQRDLVNTPRIVNILRLPILKGIEV
jgi:hypothetical protein